MANINERRVEMLQTADHRGDGETLRALVEAKIIHLAKQLNDEISRRLYARFLAHAIERFRKKRGKLSRIFQLRSSTSGSLWPSTTWCTH
jgi:hypothetical protein